MPQHYLWTQIALSVFYLPCLIFCLQTQRTSISSWKLKRANCESLCNVKARKSTWRAPAGEHFQSMARTQLEKGWKVTSEGSKWWCDRAVMKIMTKQGTAYFSRRQQKKKLSSALEGETMSSETQKDIHWMEGEGQAGRYEVLGHGRSIKMDLVTEDGRGSLLAYWDFIAVF